MEACNDSQTLVLVETVDIDRNDQLLSVVMRMIRTYTDPQRAQEDLDLIRKADQTTQYDLVKVPYIER